MKMTRKEPKKIPDFARENGSLLKKHSLSITLGADEND
jgi:hypothetical protein